MWSSRRLRTRPLIKPKKRNEVTGRPVPARQTGAGQERLQRYLARAGISSRRSCERLILEGRVSVNGRVVIQLGTKVSPGFDKVTCDGRSVAPSASLVYLILNKTAGGLTSLFDP